MPDLRYQLILGKFSITEVKPSHDSEKKFLTIDIGNKVYISFDAPANTDARVGDLLTLYTEVLASDKSGQPSIK